MEKWTGEKMEQKKHKRSILDIRERAIERASRGEISPAELWRVLRYTWEHLTVCERTTDYCRGSLELEPHNAIGYTYGA